jgi:ankyrin repeat protein
MITQHDMCDLLVESGADIHAMDNDGATPLVLANIYHNVTAFNTLLRRGAVLSTPITPTTVSIEVAIESYGYGQYITGPLSWLPDTPLKVYIMATVVY